MSSGLKKRGALLPQSLPFSLKMALQYVRPKRSLVSLVMSISAIGVTLGVAVLIIVLSVMTGFDREWRERLLGFHAHIEIVSPSGPFTDWTTVCALAEQQEGVLSAAPLIDGLVLLQTEEQMHTPLLYGIDPTENIERSRLEQHLIQGTFALRENEAVLGSGVAQRLGVQTGDIFTILSPQSLMVTDEIRLPEEWSVAGIFHMGMYEIDQGFIYAGLPLAQALFEADEQISRVEIRLENPMQAYSIANKLRNELPAHLYVQTWMQSHQQIFMALEVEKKMMFFLLAFVALVAAFSITNTLITLTIQKTREIGLFKALGFSNRSVTSIFIWMGLIQGVVGTLSGWAVAAIVLRYRNEILHALSSRWQVELLPPELYQLHQLPAETLWSDVLSVSGLVLLFCILAGALPAWRASRMKPVEALRFE